MGIFSRAAKPCGGTVDGRWQKGMPASRVCQAYQGMRDVLTS